MRVERPDLPAVLPDPDPIETVPVRWRVLTRDTLPDGPFAFFALRPEDFEALSLNQAEVLRWVAEARHRLDYYREHLGADND